ncbi:UDP-N-acetylglucosamine 2-epimerase (non-hydrolyzing) [bacterium]|nr:UDP-N-acetylglucosamine 2-epimerase (non-hydrolyzing) [bacterium]
MKIVSIVGARPQFIKASVLTPLLRERHDEILLHTGQHYDYAMSKLFFDDLGLPEPKYNLGVGSGSHGEQTGAMLAAIEKVLLSEKPDYVLVYGDTNSTLAGALAAAKIHIPVAHVEAGERIFDRRQPEETNRILTDHVSSLLFCATHPAVGHLAHEGIQTGVHEVGDVMYDRLLLSLPTAEKKSHVLKDHGLKERGYFFATVHREENTNYPDRLRSILDAFNQADCPIVFPVHPRTRKFIREMNLNVKPHVRLIEPVSYYDALLLQIHAKKILTDSGGVAREAYLLGVPCITLMEKIAIRQTVDLGWNKLVGADLAAIQEALSHFNPGGARPAVFGDGKAGEKIRSILDRQ